MKTGLVLVDIQNDYFPGGRMELVGISEAGQKAGVLLADFRDNNWPTFDYGLKCVVIEDACATRDLEFGGRTIAAGQVHGAFMAALGAAYAEVLSLEDFKSNA